MLTESHCWPAAQSYFVGPDAWRLVSGARLLAALGAHDIAGPPRANQAPAWRLLSSCGAILTPALLTILRGRQASANLTFLGGCYEGLPAGISSHDARNAQHGGGTARACSSAYIRRSEAACPAAPLCSRVSHRPALLWPGEEPGGLRWILHPDLPFPVRGGQEGNNGSDRHRSMR